MLNRLVCALFPTRVVVVVVLNPLVCAVFPPRVSLVPHSLHLYEPHIGHPLIQLAILFVSKLNKFKRNGYNFVPFAPLLLAYVSVFAL